MLILLALLQMFQNQIPWQGQATSSIKSYLEAGINNVIEDQAVNLASGFSINNLIEEHFGIKVISCSRVTHTKIEFRSRELAPCLAKNYFEERLFKDEHPIEIYYSRGDYSSHLSVIWKPNFDHIPIEIKKLEKYYNDYKSQKTHCVPPASNAVVSNIELAQTKYLNIGKFRPAPMHSPLGEIRVSLDRPNDLATLLNAPDFVARLGKLDQVGEVLFDVQMDPNDIENTLVKMDIFKRDAINPFIEAFAQVKANFSCSQYRLELDPQHAN